MKAIKIINIITMILLFLGGLNWLSIGLLQYDYISAIFGSQAAVVSRIIFSLVGISALYLALIPFFNNGRIDFNVNKEN